MRRCRTSTRPRQSTGPVAGRPKTSGSRERFAEPLAGQSATSWRRLDPRLRDGVDPLRAPCRGLERIAEVLRDPGELVVAELRDADVADGCAIAVIDRAFDHPVAAFTAQAPQAQLRCLARHRRIVVVDRLRVGASTDPFPGLWPLFHEVFGRQLVLPTSELLE